MCNMLKSKFRFKRLILFVLIILPGWVFGQNAKGYTINGKINGLEEGEKVMMLLNYYNGNPPEHFFDQFERRDSAYVKNGTFQIKGVVPDGPRQYYLEFDRHDGDSKHGQKAFRGIRLFIDNGEEISIRCDDDIDKIGHSLIEHYVTIEGSPTNFSKLYLEEAESVYHQNISYLNHALAKIKDSIGFDKSLVDGIMLAKEEANNALYYSCLYSGRRLNPDLKRGNIFMITDFEESGHAAFWKDVYDHWDEKRKASFYGQWLSSLIPLCIGQTFPNCTVQTTEGKSVELKDQFSKAKITCVHFWAERSYQITPVQDELKRFYKLYHDKGFNIIGFSSNQYADQWKGVIAANQLSSWMHVSDLKGRDGVIAKVYKEYGDPDITERNTTNVLIDAQGKIIAWDVTGLELQWYIAKYVGNGDSTMKQHLGQ